MDIEFRLKSILMRYGLDGHGKFKRIEKETGIKRRMIQSIYNNTRTRIDLAVLARLCEWLERRNMREDLPGALFGYRPSGLVDALAKPSRISLFVGEYRQTPDEPAGSYLARADSEVASTIMELVPPGVTYNQVFVPSRPVGRNGTTWSTDALTKDARSIFQALRRERPGGPSAVFVGSQRANFVVELFVAELLGCQPFARPHENVPFYFYRGHDQPDPIPSCFGGSSQPPGLARAAKRSVYVQTTPNEWKSFPCVDGRRSSGVVLVVRDPGIDHTEVALLGYSAEATIAIGEVLRLHPDCFWPPKRVVIASRALDVGAWVCDLNISRDGQGLPRIDDKVIRPINVLSCGSCHSN